MKSVKPAMVKPMHSLLRRQIRRYFGEEESLPKELREFAEAVNQAYEKADYDYALLERAQELNEKELERQIREKELILTSAGEGIFGIGLDGKITFINPAGAQSLGCKESELAGKHVQTVVQRLNSDGSPEPAGDSPMLRTLDDITPHRAVETSFWRKDGTSFPVECACASVVENGKITGAVVVFKDITERRQTDQARKRVAAELEQNNRNLREFIAFASHDLKEPLRKVMTFGSLLEKRYAARLDPEGLDYLGRMVKATERMQRFLDDLFQFSTVGLKTKRVEPVDLEALIHEVVSDLEARIAHSGGEVVFEKDPEKPAPVFEADKFQMHQLFLNLIGNALKFQKKDVPPVVVIGAETGENDFLEIRVRDNGIGFDEKYAERIFRPFERLNAKSAYEGSGMGLAICMKIATGHGGEIAARSAPDRGTTFVIALPKKYSG